MTVIVNFSYIINLSDWLYITLILDKLSHNQPVTQRSCLFCVLKHDVMSMSRQILYWYTGLWNPYSYFQIILTNQNNDAYN